MKQAQPLTLEHEEKVWSLGIFSLCIGWGLTNIVFWYNCKLFGLNRGGDEDVSVLDFPAVIYTDHSGVTVIYVYPRNVCPRTYFTSDNCSPGTDITSIIGTLPTVIRVSPQILMYMEII